MPSRMWMMRTTQEYVDRAGKVAQEHAETASSYVKWKRWKFTESSHCVCLIGYSGPFFSDQDESTDFFNQEHEFCINSMVEEFVIQILRPPTETPSPGYTNIAVRLERGEDGSVVQQEANSSSTDYGSHVVLSTFKLGMCITISRRDCDSAADSAAVQHHPRVKSKGLCFEMPGFDMELLGDLVLAHDLSDGEGLSGQTLYFKIIDDENDDFCIRFTRTKNSTNNRAWTIVKTTIFPGASSTSESTAYNNKYFALESEDIENNNSVGESCSEETTFTLEFVVQHGLSKASSNVDTNETQGFHELPYDDPQYEDFSERENALLQLQMQHEAIELERQHEAILNRGRIAQRHLNITTLRLLGGGCKCCEEKGCWDESCNSAKCRNGCNCW